MEATRCIVCGLTIVSALSLLPVTSHGEQNCQWREIGGRWECQENSGKESGDDNYPRILKNVPVEVRGLWCLYSRTAPTPNPWTGKPATEWAFNPCADRRDKTDPRRWVGPVPDLTITEDYIHFGILTRCHVDRVAEFDSGGYILALTCQDRKQRNPKWVPDRDPMWIGRGKTGDLRVVGDIK